MIEHGSDATASLVNAKLAVVVPYRDRESHLRQFLPHIVDHLKAQGIAHRIVIVQQEFGKPFNRAKLLNAGFDLSRGDCEWFAFHDVDLLPTDADYSFPVRPTHLSAYCSQFDYILPYDTMFGGVTLFSKEHFARVNGYSNEYWGWGGEDDDMYDRVTREGLGFHRRPGRYTSLTHSAQVIVGEEYKRNLDRLQAQEEGVLSHREDGLSSLTYFLNERVELQAAVTKYGVSL